MKRCGLLLCVGLLIQGCHTVSQIAPQRAGTWQSHQKNLKEVTHWSIDGKFSFHKDKTTIGAFQWQQNRDVYTLHFTGPMSVGSARLEGNAKQATFLQQDHNPLTAASPEALLMQYMGWNIPLTPLQYWIKGQLIPGEPAKVLWDEHQYLRSIKQGGWEVILSDYQMQQGVALPSRLTLKRSDMWVKLVVKSWRWWS